MKLSHTLLAVLINLLWGSMYVAASIGLRDFPPILFTGIRFTLLVLCLFPFLKVPRDLIRPLIKVGLLMGTGMYLSLYLSVSLASNISSIALFSKLEVPFAILLGVLLLGEKIGINRILGITIAMSGAMVIGFDPAAFNDIPALVWMAISCGFAAYGMIRIRELGSIHPLTIVVWISLVSSPTLLATSLVFENNHWDVVVQASTVGWLALLYTAFMSSVVANSGLYYLLRHYPVSQVAPYSLLSPIFGVIGGVWLLGDEITLILIVGGMMILAGVAWIHFRSRHLEQAHVSAKHDLPVNAKTGR
ncbi:MAG: EamA family transporter [Pseudomonadota bacterium]